MFFVYRIYMKVYFYLMLYGSVFQPLCARETSANICFAQGALRNDPSIYSTFINKPGG